MKKFVRFGFVFAVLLSICQQATPAQYVAPDAEGTSKIKGKILDTDGKPVAGAQALAYHLSTGKLYSSKPTGNNGEYLVTGLPYGYFDLAIETPDGLFVANRVVNLAPSSTAAVILTVVPYAPAAEIPPREYPARDLPPSGSAEVREKPKGREFWRSPKGVAVLSGIGGAALLALAVGSDEEPATVF